MAQITDLPVELLIMIFSFLEDSSEEPDQSICMTVCRRWYEIILGMALLPGTEYMPLLFYKSIFNSFICDLFKSPSLLEWSQILELAEKYQYTDYSWFASDKHFDYTFNGSYLAIENGNLDVLKYIIEFKNSLSFSLNVFAIDLVISRNDMDILKFLILKGFEINDYYINNMMLRQIAEAAKKNPDLMKYLRKSGMLEYFPLYLRVFLRSH